MKQKKRIIIATRNSRLALWQAEYVKSALKALYPELEIELLARTTTGDSKQNISLAQIGGKNLFTKELQQAILSGEADIAVHSVKDLAAKTQPGLFLAAILKREDARDVFISQQYSEFSNLPLHSVIGTASPRRQCQILAHRPDLNIKLLRGNVETRLAKLEAGEYDAIVLAAAGLKRLGLESNITHYFNFKTILPAIGQGAIGIECRADDTEMQDRVLPLNDAITHYCVSAERAVNEYLGGDCFTPIAAHAICKQDQLTLTALIGALDGSRVLHTEIQGLCSNAFGLGVDAAKQLLALGAENYLR